MAHACRTEDGPEAGVDTVGRRVVGLPRRGAEGRAAHGRVALTLSASEPVGLWAPAPAPWDPAGVKASPWQSEYAMVTSIQYASS